MTNRGASGHDPPTSDPRSSIPPPTSSSANHDQNQTTISQVNLVYHQILHVIEEIKKESFDLSMILYRMAKFKSAESP